MADEQIIEDLVKLLREINEAQKSLNNEYQRLEVAISGVLRLIGDQAHVIRGLGGDRDQLTRYVIQELTRLRDETEKRMASLADSVEAIRERVAKTISDRGDEGGV